MAVVRRGSMPSIWSAIVTNAWPVMAPLAQTTRAGTSEESIPEDGWASSRSWYNKYRSQRRASFSSLSVYIHIYYVCCCASPPLLFIYVDNVTSSREARPPLVSKLFMKRKVSNSRTGALQNTTVREYKAQSPWRNLR